MSEKPDIVERLDDMFNRTAVCKCGGGMGDNHDFHWNPDEDTMVLAEARLEIIRLRGKLGLPAILEDTNGSEREASRRGVMPAPDSASRKTGASECGTDSPASTTARAGHGANTPRDDGAADRRNAPPSLDEIESLRAEIKRLRARFAAAEIERLRAALDKIAEHHEDQAEAWGGEEGDTNNVRYHSKRARFANAAFDPPA